MEPGRSAMKCIFPIASLLFCAVLFPACQGSETVTPVGAAPTSMPSLAEAIATAQENVASVGAMSDNGLEVRLWIVADRPRELAAAFEANCEEVVAPGRNLDRLHENGFRLYRVPVESLGELRKAVGGATRVEQWWFGQVLRWRTLWSRALGQTSRGIAIDGRVRRFRGGDISLLVRAWTMKTEDGPQLQFEMVPYHSARQGGYRRFTNQRERNPLGSPLVAGEAFESMAVNLRLDPGYAYVLTCDAEVTARRGRDLPDRTSSGEVRGSVGPRGDFGPLAVGPATLADALLRGEEPAANRLLVVLIPRVPRVLFPPELWRPSGALDGFEGAPSRDIGLNE